MQFLDKVFLHARCCATCVLVQTVFYTVAFPQLQFFTVVVVAFTLCSLSLSAGPCCQASTLLGPLLGQVVLARRCTTPGAVYVRAVRSVARGDTIGAVLGRGLGHYDRCRGLDSAQLHVLFKVVDFLIVALRQFPVVLVRLPSCFSLVVDVPVVLMQQVVPCPW